MNSPQIKSPRIAVVGGGITGLAAAHRLHELLPAAQVTIFEANDRLGGVLSTVERETADGKSFLIERSADSFITKMPWAADLCRRIGFADELIPTQPGQRQAMVVRRGNLLKVPDGFVLMSPRRMWPIMMSRLLGPLGKLRLAWEYFVSRRKEAGDESLESFARRRLGRQVFERLVQPLVGGIYTADPAKLSMRAAMPQFVQMERDWRSLIRASLKMPKSADEQHASGARYSMFVTPKRGMSSLVGAIAAKLPPGTVRLNSPVMGLARVSNADASTSKWRLQLFTDITPQEFDSVIVASPAGAAAKLVQSVDAELAGELSGIPYAGTAIALLAYRRDQIAHALDSFGFVVPAIEKRQILSASFSSVKFPGRAPDDCVLVRAFLGGALQPELLNLSDSELLSAAKHDLADLIGARGAPLLAEVARWHGAMPQYQVGHVERVARIKTLVEKHPGLSLAGNAYEGVGIPQCIRSGEQAAERVAKISDFKFQISD